MYQKCFSGSGSAPHVAGGARSAPDPLAAFGRPLCSREGRKAKREGKWTEGRGREGQGKE